MIQNDKLTWKVECSWTKYGFFSLNCDNKSMMSFSRWMYSVLFSWTICRFSQTLMANSRCEETSLAKNTQEYEPSPISLPNINSSGLVLRGFSNDLSHPASWWPELPLLHSFLSLVKSSNYEKIPCKHLLARWRWGFVWHLGPKFNYFKLDRVG